MSPMRTRRAGAGVQSLIAALDTDDVREQRRAGDALIAAGGEAVPNLITALCTGPPRVRKSAAFLLGRCKASRDVVDALCQAVVEDPEPKVRKNAAVSLGRSGTPEGVEALTPALRQETVRWVRTSIILALGAAGGDAARATLLAIDARDDAEREALRKALDRIAPHDHRADWRREVAWRHELLLEVPVGLEAVALDEAAEHGLIAIAQAAPGHLLCPPDLPPWKVLPELRCVSTIYVHAGQAPPVPTDNAEEAARAIAALLSESPQLRSIRDWVRTEGDTLRYRFSLSNRRVRREDLRAMLDAVRAICRPLGLVDSPSSYDVELVVSTDRFAPGRGSGWGEGLGVGGFRVVGVPGLVSPEQVGTGWNRDQTRKAGSNLSPSATRSHLLIKPSFMRDDRFAYRQRDVGAAIDPVVGACLARLVRTPDGGTVFDPTCGSGTLLVERALIGDNVRLAGLDVSSTAVTAARTNITAAGLGKRVRIARGNAMDPERWPRCGEVVANLPFGLRTRRAEANLDDLYEAVLANSAARLSPGGHAVLYTANRKALERGLSRHEDSLLVSDHLRVESGGLRCEVWVLTARG